MTKFPLFICAGAVIALAGCGGTRVVDLNNAADVSDMTHVMELEYRDWTKTAENMTTSMLKTGSFARVKDPVISMGPMINDTMQRFDTDILTKKIRTSLVNSGRAQIATNFGGEDVSSNKVRTMRGNAEYAADSIARSGTLVAPNLSLSGKMLQRNMNIKSGWFSSTDTRVEYYLQLTLTDLKTGLSIWEGEEPIIKEGTNAPTW